MDTSGNLLGTQTLQGSAKVLLSKTGAATDRLLAVRSSGRDPVVRDPIPPPPGTASAASPPAWPPAATTALPPAPTGDPPRAAPAVSPPASPAAAPKGAGHPGPGGARPLGREAPAQDGTPPQRSVADAGAACLSGDVEACKDVAMSYTAFAYAKEACDLGEPVGCSNLALFYESGKGVPRADRLKAQRYYERACQHGHEESCAAHDRLARATAASDAHVHTHHAH